MRAPSVAETLLDLLTSRSRERGTLAAILSPGRDALSYGALQSEVERAGAALAAMRLGRGSRIALALPDGPEAAVATLAVLIWATGAPLNPALDLAACRDLLPRLRVDALIVPEGHASPASTAAEELGIPLVRLSSNPADAAGVLELRAESVGARPVQTAPTTDDVALVLHTSGTTGKPKIVPLTHAQLYWSAHTQPLGDGDRGLCFAPLFTRGGLVMGLLAPLARGAGSIITTGYDAARFFDWLDAFRPTYYSAGPTIQASILDAMTQHEVRPPHSLRFIRSSSNALPMAIRNRLESAFGVPVIQGYAMTEAGLVAQDALPPGERRDGSVGRPDAADVMIASEDAEALPYGTTGEILVRGPSIVRGYEGDADANRLAFHEGWYRTGDLGHLDADGYLFISGRIKELINRGGHKVSPAEVDELFMRHPAVRDAATVGVPHPSLGEDVVTAVVLREPGSIAVQQLRRYAMESIAPYKSPSSVVVVDELPRNALGKLRRHVLAERVQAALRAEFVAPRDDDEKLIAGIVAQVLNLPRVGVLDDFFRLGGDSLRAMRVLARLRSVADIEIELSALFVTPTVADLALHLRAAAGRARHRPPLLRRPEAGKQAASAEFVDSSPRKS